MANKDTDAPTAYPLVWPAGWPRTPAEKRDGGARFKEKGAWRSITLGAPGSGYYETRSVTFDSARKKLAAEIERLGAKDPILSTNVPLRLDGAPRAGEIRAGTDPGVAIYFRYRDKPMVMACDRFASLAANVRSLGLAIEALRALERHGGGTMMERAFTGFAALPPPIVPQRRWQDVLEFMEEEISIGLTEADVQAAYRRLAKSKHPDVEGGSAEAMTELNAARDEALRSLGG